MQYVKDLLWLQEKFLRGLMQMICINRMITSY